MSSLSKLIVGGFKSIRERTEIPIAPLTFLFGPNSAGKSAVLGAARALRGRIQESIEERSKKISHFLGPAVIRQGLAHSRPFGVTAKVGGATSVPLHLGACVEGFSSLNVIFDEDCRGEAKAFFGALHGAFVEVEVVQKDEAVQKDWPEHWYTPLGATESFLRVDGVDLFHFVPVGFAALIGLPANLYEDCWQVAPNGERPHLGAVRVNLEHPLWTMTSISKAQKGLSFLFSEMGSDSLRDSFVNSLQQLQAQIAMPELNFLNESISVDGQWLTIGTRVEELLSGMEWFPNLLLPPIDPVWTWQDLGIKELSDNFLNLVKSVNEVLAVVNDLCKPVLQELMNALSVVAIDGDRQILRPENVTVNFTADEAGEVDANYWYTDHRKTESTENQNLGANTLSLYAKWLGLKNAGDGVVSNGSLGKIRSRDDFVNSVLSRNLFGVRRYQVKPAMWKITTTTLLDRDVASGTELFDEDDLNQISAFKVQLFLEDQNGRRLDFEEVGSGISYVLPILASLHAAKTSWIAQPELHLHPAAQCEMGDVFLRAFNRGHFSVVETHSEHLLLRVLKRIRQTTRGLGIDDDLKCAPEAVSVLYFDPQEDGSTEIKQMRVSRLGDFKDRWPHGFFEERGRELFDE